MSIEAMKQALEALEVEQTVYLRTKLPAPEYLTKAITSLRQAIAEAEKQQRTWVGLTDEEIYEIYEQVERKVGEHWNSGGTTMMFPITLYKAIEAKLKDKNT